LLVMFVPLMFCPLMKILSWFYPVDI
jgi:hypothetical protein